jgi:hypothetical protein
VVPKPLGSTGGVTFAQLVTRYSLASIKLGQSPLNLGVDIVFIFLQPCLLLGLHFESVEEHVFDAVERTAVQPLLNERFDFATVYFDGHGVVL